MMSCRGMMDGNDCEWIDRIDTVFHACSLECLMFPRHGHCTNLPGAARPSLPPVVVIGCYQLKQDKEAVTTLGDDSCGIAGHDSGGDGSSTGKDATATASASDNNGEDAGGSQESIVSVSRWEGQLRLYTIDNASQQQLSPHNRSYSGQDGKDSTSVGTAPSFHLMDILSTDYGILDTRWFNIVCPPFQQPLQQLLPVAAQSNNYVTNSSIGVDFNTTMPPCSSQAAIAETAQHPRSVLACACSSGSIELFELLWNNVVDNHGQDGEIAQEEDGNRASFADERNLRDVPSETAHQITSDGQRCRATTSRTLTNDRYSCSFHHSKRPSLLPVEAVVIPQADTNSDLNEKRDAIFETRSRSRKASTPRLCLSIDVECADWCRQGIEDCGEDYALPKISHAPLSLVQSSNGMNRRTVSSYSDGTLSVHQLTISVESDSNSMLNSATEQQRLRANMEETHRWTGHSLHGGHPAEIWTCCFAQNNNFTTVEQENNIVLSGGDDCMLKGWDLRTIDSSSARPLFSIGTDQFYKDYCSCSDSGGVTSVSYHPTLPYNFASGSYGGVVKVWDIRYLKHALQQTKNLNHQNEQHSSTPIPSLVGLSNHCKGGIWRIKWHPHFVDTILVAAMHHGCHVIKFDCLASEALLDSSTFCSCYDSKGTTKADKGNIISSFTGHESMAYGAAWVPSSSTREFKNESRLQSAGANMPRAAILKRDGESAIDDYLKSGGPANMKPYESMTFQKFHAASCSFYDHKAFIWDGLHCKKNKNVY